MTKSKAKDQVEVDSDKVSLMDWLKSHNEDLEQVSHGIMVDINSLSTRLHRLRVAFVGPKPIEGEAVKATERKLPDIIGGLIQVIDAEVSDMRTDIKLVVSDMERTICDLENLILADLSHPEASVE